VESEEKSGRTDPLEEAAAARSGEYFAARAGLDGVHGVTLAID
jgi:hypothetical protein